MTETALETFADPASLDDALAHAIADALHRRVDAGGTASLAVSGGKTPAGLFARLANTDLPWQKITVLLVDERWLPAGHPDSNTRLVRETLLTGKAAAARWLDMSASTAPLQDAIDTIDRQLTALPLPIDVVVLGMGNDGHTASLFPCAEETAAGLDPQTRARIIAVHPTTAPYPRLSLTLPVIASARNLFLHIVGDTKRQVLASAFAPTPSPLPIARVWRAASGCRRIFWSA